MRLPGTRRAIRNYFIFSNRLLSNSEEAGEREWRKVASQIMVIHSYNKGGGLGNKDHFQLEDKRKKSSVYMIDQAIVIHDPLSVEELVQMCVEAVTTIHNFISYESMM